MKLSTSLKAFAVVLALSPLGFAGSAMANDDDGDGNPVVGIIGQVIGGAIEAEAAKEEARDQERRCSRLQYKCNEGSEWACAKVEESCGD